MIECKWLRKGPKPVFKTEQEDAWMEAQIWMLCTMPCYVTEWDCSRVSEEVSDQPLYDCYLKEEQAG